MDDTELIVENYFGRKITKGHYVPKNIRVYLMRCVQMIKILTEDLGRRVILAPTSYGGPRWNQSRYQDAMAYVCHYGTKELWSLLC